MSYKTIEFLTKSKKNHQNTLDHNQNIFLYLFSFYLNKSNIRY